MTGFGWEVVVTATSSVAHSGESLGTVRYLRRERVLAADNTVVEIPIVSGNSVRGRMRDIGATLWWDDAAQPLLPPAVAHAIFSGGALTKHVGDPLNGYRLRDLKELCLPLGVFGAAGGGRIIDGTIQVGKMVPIAEQTRILLPEWVTGGGETSLPDLWDLTQIEWYSRHPNKVNPVGEPFSNDDTGVPALARFGVETFLPGTRFYWWLAADRMSLRTAGFVNDVVENFLAHGRVGGDVRVGHGMFNANIHHKPGVDVTNDNSWRRNQRGLTVDELKMLAWLQ